MDTLHDPVTWYKISYARTQVTDFQNELLCFGSPQKPSWKPQCVTCVPAKLTLYHATGSCKRPVVKYEMIILPVTRAYSISLSFTRRKKITPFIILPSEYATYRNSIPHACATLRQWGELSNDK